MRTCTRCGFPTRYSRFLAWNSDGTVTGSVRPTIPMMFMEVAEWDAVSGELSNTLGLPIDHIVIEAEKRIGKDLYEMFKGIYHLNLKRVPNSRLLRPQWMGKLFIRALRRDISGIGNGSVTVEEYRTGESLRVRFKNPCLVPVVVGNCLGLYESLETMPGSSAEYRLDGGDLVVQLSHAEETPGYEDRLYLEEVEPGVGPLRFDRCEHCGVPIKMGRSLSWDLPRGVITNPLTGRREVMVAVQSIGAILRELERELGNEIVEILYTAQKRFSLGHLEGVKASGADAFWQEFLTEMALRGLGYPTEFETAGDSISVDMRNAYDQELYAAKLAAGLEKLTGRGSNINWELRERDHSRYTISTGAAEG